jgi:molecular chaperone Hsp33
MIKRHSFSPMNDRLLRYYFPEIGVRAGWVRLERAHERLHALSIAPVCVRHWLSELAAASALLQSSIHLDGKLSVQLQAQGELRLLFAECSSTGYLRGIARVKEGQAVVPEDFALATQGGLLAINIDANHAERYQGLVALDPQGLARSFEHYFEASEQLPSKLMLHSGATHTTGFMLQRVAQDGGALINDPDGWDRLQILFETLKPSELDAVDEHLLMQRLFHHENLQVLGEQTLHHFCPCSRERVGAMLVSIGLQDALAATEDGNGFASIHCEFCNAEYRFDRVDIAKLFHDAGPSSSAIN